MVVIKWEPSVYFCSTHRKEITHWCSISTSILTQTWSNVWVTSEILCVHLMDGQCFIKMHAFSWKVLDPGKEVWSLDFEPAIKSRVVRHLKSCLLDICFSEMALISPLQILMTDILSVTERSYEWNPWQFCCGDNLV